MSANLTISPDGRHLAWTAIDSTTHLWSVDARPSHAEPAPPIALTRGIGIFNGSPAPAGDGRIAFAGSRHGSAASLFLLSPDGATRQLTIDASGHYGPQWMPGRTEVAVVADHGEGPAFWSLNVVSGRERLLFRLADLPRVAGNSQPSTATPAANIAFAPDFTRLAMSVVRGGVADVWIASLDRGRPSGPLVQRTFERSGGTYPVWSADGRWIAYQCGERTDTHVCAIDSVDGQRVQLTSEPGQSWIGGWAPDNDTIVYASRRSGIWNVASVSKSTRVIRSLTRFTEPRVYVRYPRWDASAGRVVFERSETSGRIWGVEVKE
jgi:Tol biopolymer transport system component